MARSLTQLALGHNNLDATSAQQLSKVLTTNTSITALSLVANKIGPDVRLLLLLSGVLLVSRVVRICCLVPLARRALATCRTR